MNAIVRLPHPRSGDSQGQETFLAPSADKQTRNYDIECSNIYIYIYMLFKEILVDIKIKFKLCIYLNFCEIILLGIPTCNLIERERMIL